MSSILETIQTFWATKKDLTDLVPATQVFLGPPNPGSKQPCVGLVGERIDQLAHTSTGQYLQVEVELVAQADSLDLLESLREAIRHHIDGWTSTRYQALQQRGLTMTIQRPTNNPSRLWQAEATILFDVHLST